MKSIYNFGIYCYKQLVALAGIRNVKARKLTQGQKGIFDYLSRRKEVICGYMPRPSESSNKDVRLSKL